MNELSAAAAADGFLVNLFPREKAAGEPAGFLVDDFRNDHVQCLARPDVFDVETENSFESRVYRGYFSMGVERGNAHGSAHEELFLMCVPVQQFPFSLFAFCDFPAQHRVGRGQAAGGLVHTAAQLPCPDDGGCDQHRKDARCQHHELPVDGHPEVLPFPTRQQGPAFLLTQGIQPGVDFLQQAAVSFFHGCMHGIGAYR